jgi:hypothetical protein
MNIHHQMHRWFLRELLSTARGRAFVLTQASELAAAATRRILVPPPTGAWDAPLDTMIARHRSDELRHAALCGECAARQGAPPLEIPSALRHLDAIEPRLDAVPGRDETPVGRLLVVQVLEERAIQDLRALASALRPFDPRSAGIMVEIAATERRHLREYEAAVRASVPARDVTARLLSELRRAEALAYREHTRACVDYLVAHGFVGSRTKQLLWRGVGAAAVLVDLPWTDAGRSRRRGRVRGAPAAP